MGQEKVGEKSEENPDEEVQTEGPTAAQDFKDGPSSQIFGA